jgi:hypothetical protein
MQMAVSCTNEDSLGELVISTASPGVLRCSVIRVMMAKHFEASLHTFHPHSPSLPPAAAAGASERALYPNTDFAPAFFLADTTSSRTSSRLEVDHTLTTTTTTTTTTSSTTSTTTTFYQPDL